MFQVNLTRPAGKPYTQEQRVDLKARQQAKLEATFQRIQSATRNSFITLCFLGIGTVLLPILFSGSIPSINAIPPLVITVAVVGSVATAVVFLYWIDSWVQRTENTEILHQKLEASWKGLCTQYYSETEPLSYHAEELLDRGLIVSFDLLQSYLPSSRNVSVYLSQGGDVSKLSPLLLQDMPCNDDRILACILKAVDHGFDVNSLTPAGNSVLHRHLALQTHAYHSVRFLSFLYAGADPTLKNRQGETVMDLLFDVRNTRKFTSADSYYEYLRAYIPAIVRKAPQLINQPLKNGNSPLLDIIARPPDIRGFLDLEKHTVDIVKFLIENGADVNAQNPVTGDTALHMAARADNGELFELLLQKGARMDTRNKAEQAPVASIQANFAKGNCKVWAVLCKNPQYEAFIVKHLPKGTT